MFVKAQLLLLGLKISLQKVKSDIYTFLFELFSCASNPWESCGVCDSASTGSPYKIFKGVLCSYGEEIKIVNFNISNINEEIIQTFFISE